MTKEGSQPQKADYHERCGDADRGDQRMRESSAGSSDWPPIRQNSPTRGYRNSDASNRLKPLVLPPLTRGELEMTEYLEQHDIPRTAVASSSECILGLSKPVYDKDAHLEQFAALLVLVFVLAMLLSDVTNGI